MKMHYGGEKLGQNRGRDPNHHQNLIKCSLGHSPPLQIIHQNLLITFWGIFFTREYRKLQKQPAWRRQLKCVNCWNWLWHDDDDDANHDDICAVCLCTSSLTINFSISSVIAFSILSHFSSRSVTTTTSVLRVSNMLPITTCKHFTSLHAAAAKLLRYSHFPLGLLSL